MSPTNTTLNVKINNAESSLICHTVVSTHLWEVYTVYTIFLLLYTTTNKRHLFMNPIHEPNE